MKGRQFMEDRFPFYFRCYYEDDSILTFEFICEKRCKDIEYDQKLICYALDLIYLAQRYCGSPISRDIEQLFTRDVITRPNTIICSFSVFFKNNYNRKRFLDDLCDYLN